MTFKVKCENNYNTLSVQESRQLLTKNRKPNDIYHDQISSSLVLVHQIIHQFVRSIKNNIPMKMKAMEKQTNQRDMV